MGYEFGRATTAAEIEAVQRLRYAVYVEEMNRYEDVEGGDDGRFAEPEDEHSWICYARDGDEVVAATRMTWGGDGFSDRQIDQYQLAPFLAELPAEVMGSRRAQHGAPVAPRQRRARPAAWRTAARQPTCRTSASCSAAASRTCCRST